MTLLRMWATRVRAGLQQRTQPAPSERVPLAPSRGRGSIQNDFITHNRRVARLTEVVAPSGRLAAILSTRKATEPACFLRRSPKVRFTASNCHSSRRPGAERPCGALGRQLTRTRFLAPEPRCHRRNRVPRPSVRTARSAARARCTDLAPCQVYRRVRAAGSAGPRVAGPRPHLRGPLFPAVPTVQDAGAPLELTQPAPTPCPWRRTFTPPCPQRFVGRKPASQHHTSLDGGALSFISACFSRDGKHLACLVRPLQGRPHLLRYPLRSPPAQTDGPDYTLVMWEWARAKVIAQHALHTPLSVMRLNPQDFRQVRTRQSLRPHGPPPGPRPDPLLCA